MPQFYTLEEAARVLGMSPESLKLKAQQREIRAFMDSGSWRFRVADVDELARRQGMGSDPDISLSDPDLFAPPSEMGSNDDLGASEFQLGVSKFDAGPPSVEMATGTGEQDLLLDDIKVPPNPMTGSSSTIIGMERSSKRPADSDVRIVPPTGLGRGASDSDVRVVGVSDSDVKLKGGGIGKRLSDSDVTLVSDDVIPPAPSGLKTDPKAAQFGSSAEIDAAKQGSSDFELSPSDKFLDALKPDSGSDFELTALDASSDEFDSIAAKPSPSDSDVTAAEPSASGINLGRPSDSGINLQQVGGLGMADVDSIELAPLDSEDDYPQSQSKPAAKAPAGKAPAAKSKQAVNPGATIAPGMPSPGATIAPGMMSPGATIAPGMPSPGATIAPGMMSPGATIAPGMRAPGATMAPGTIRSDQIARDKDIFEDTDFEVEAIGGSSDRDDRTMQIDAASDFDVDDSDSASEVFALDEEDVDQNAATAMAPSVVSGDDEFSSDEGPTSSEMASSWEEEGASSGIASAAVPSQVQAPMISAPSAGAEWSGLWVGFLSAATVLMLFLAFVSFDLVRNLYPRPSADGEASPPATSGIVKSLASLIGG